MSRTLVSVAIAATLTLSTAHAASPADLTIYRSDDTSLFSATGKGPVQAGYAVVHEQRMLELKAGKQNVTLDGLPAQLDSEALDLHFADQAGIHTQAKRLLLPGNAGLLSTHVGEPVTVYSNSGQVLAKGRLLAAGNELLIGDDQGGTIVVHDFAAVHLASADVRSGARLQVALQAARAGRIEARLDYPTGGLGWRAAYVAVLNDAQGHCSMQVNSDASIANRSGRDWSAAVLKLVAGQPRFAKASAPQPYMRGMAMQAMAAPESLPEQATLGDYRSYAIDGSIDLPDGSVTQVPLYAQRIVDCRRNWLYENSSAWLPPQPRLQRDADMSGEDSLSSHLHFRAFDTLPAGYLRVLGVIDGRRELLGEARINDTPKDQPVDLQLGTPFDLRGQHERTAFTLDKAAHTLDESFRITVSNAGDVARTVTLREHPNRWRNWKLVSASSKPVKTSPDSLDFEVVAPAHGKASVDYSVRYNWTADDE